jgi:glycine dehydrogenase subunit 2
MEELEMYRQAKYDEPLIFDLSKKGRRAHIPPRCDFPRSDINIPENMQRTVPPELPEIHEGEVMRHYVRLAQMNYCVDTGIYPLGSCTMKYNPKINETIARAEKVMYLHPNQPEETVQGILQILYELQVALGDLAGLPYTTLQTPAGASGEYCGLALIKAYHEDHGDLQRDEIIAPDSSHGTNPASTVMNGMKLIEIKSNEDGRVDMDALKAAVSEKTAGLMLTNPNTLGIFEKDIIEMSNTVRDAGGLLYYDGANFNAIVGKIRPGDMGYDVLHFNLHKTFSTPHGGGGPGSASVSCNEILEPYLPVPTIDYDEDKDYYFFNYDRPKSIGKLHGYYGNVGIALRAYSYIAALGLEGLQHTAEQACLTANYAVRKLEKIDGFRFSHGPSIPRKHEGVLEATPALRKYDVSGKDIGKMILNHGMHAPTVYFPLIAHEAWMVEPTENENKDSIDRYVAAVEEEMVKARADAEYAHHAPHNAAVSRVDIGWSVKNLIVSNKILKEKRENGEYVP